MSDIGVKLGVEGEREFKSALKDINTNLKTLGTEMKAVTSVFDKNDTSVENLAGQNQVLNKQIDEQKNKLDLLKGKLAESAAEYGENDAKTQKWQQAVNLATADLNKMERQLDNNNKELDETAKASDKAGDGIEDAGDKAEKSGGKFEKLGGVLKGIGVGMAAVAAAAGAAALAIGKQVVSAYADYEQLVGGVDTLFKDSSAALQDYANDAYKTAGLSANEYMETVTSFSASLISSLGGDTEAAVKYADMAITDMSDNANKMGTDMASIQNAYQGFSKQNYTMLDNLKLGYGGTKAEMERLLADAEKISGFKYDVSSYADIVDAIHVVQTEMGITGTTALEAEETITGSANAMKSAWQNWLVGLGNSKADMAKLTQNLVDGFTNIVKNITPIIENIVSALPAALEALLPAIAGLLPMLLETATSLFGQVLDTLMKLLPELMPVAVDAVMTIVDTLVENLPLLIDAAFELITALAEGILEALPELIPKIVTVINTIVLTIIENLPLIMAVAVQIIVALASGLISSIPELVKAVPGLITAIVNAFNDWKARVVNIGKDIVRGVWEGIKAMGAWLKERVSDFFGGIVDGVKGVLGIKSPSKVFAGIGEYMAQGLGEGFANEMQNVAKQINNSVPTDIEMTGSYAATARMNEGLVNGLAALMNNNSSAAGGTYIINLNLDGKTVAQTIFDPLKNVAKQRGVALG